MSKAEESTGDRYTDYAATRPPLAQRFHERRARRLAAAIAPEARSVLEIGPGDGLLARTLVDRGCAYTGLDISAAAAAAMQNRGFDVTVAEVPPFPAGDAVDVVVASHVIEHMPGPGEVVGFLRSAAERLGAGGRIFLLYPDARRFGFNFWESDYTHTWPSTARRIDQAVADAGLRVVGHSHRCATFSGPLGTLLWQLSRLLPLRVMEALDRSRADTWYRARLLFVPEVLTEIAVDGDGAAS